MGSVKNENINSSFVSRFLSLLRLMNIRVFIM